MGLLNINANVIGVRSGALLNLLQFIIANNQTTVGTINEPLASSFVIQQGIELFTVSNSGIVAKQTVSNYDTQRKYSLRVLSDKAKKYLITVYVTIFQIGYLWTGAEKIYDDTLFLA